MLRQDGASRPSSQPGGGRVMSEDRASIFETDDEFDVSGFAPKKPAEQACRKAGAGEGGL